MDNENNETFLSLNKLSWKIVPQIKSTQNKLKSKVFEYLSSNNEKKSDVESFVWNWSPCGRYGIDMPGGRDIVGFKEKEFIAVFDLYQLSWQFYKVVGITFLIPRVAFIYWISVDIIVFVELIKEEDDINETEVDLEFKQVFLKIDHEKSILKCIQSCVYKTHLSVPITYWYHIFENRRGEPFIDRNRNSWLVFSNAKDYLILIPFVPTSKCNEVKYIKFNIIKLFEERYGETNSLDPFLSSHFVPHVFKNEINFFLQSEPIDDNSEFSPRVQNSKLRIHHLNVDLAEVLYENEFQDYDSNEKEMIISMNDIKWIRVIDFDENSSQKSFKNITQIGKMLTITEWRFKDSNQREAERLATKIGKWENRWRIDDNLKFIVINLESGVLRKFKASISITDVVIPHPSGPMLMFRYKENYGMCMSELPYFNPFSLFIKSMNVVNKCIYIDTTYKKYNTIESEISNEH